MKTELIPSHTQPLPAWLKWGLPAAIFLYPAILIIPGMNWEAHVYREYGLVETLSNIFLLIAFVLAVRASRLASNSLQRAWSMFFALGCFLFLGEEIS